MSILKYSRYSHILFVAMACLLPSLASCTDEDLPDNAAPSLSVQEAANVLRTSVVLNGSITGATNQVKTYGFQYSESENFPADRTTDVPMQDEGLPQGGNVTKQVKDLTPNETYYYRLYASTGATTVYSKSVQFRTANMSSPQIANIVTDSIGERVVRISFDIEDYGNEVLIEVGLGYKKSDSKTFIPVAADELTADDHYTVQITGLDADTQYDFRPYAKNAADKEASTGSIEGYGDIISQKTAALLSADVTTIEVVDDNIGINSVKVAGKVESAKGSDGEISGCGFVWSATVKSPTMEFCDGSLAVKPEYDMLPFTFAANITSLDQSTTYYICAYATNYVDGQERIAYGEVREIETKGLAKPQVEFVMATNDEGYSYYDVETTATTIQVKVNIKNYDSYACAERGVIWSKSTADITLDAAGDNKLVVVSDSKQFTALIENLEVGSSYFVRGYAIYKAGDQQVIGYADALNCSTSGFTKPSLESVEVNSEKITRNSAEITGKISSVGNGTITERGFVLSPSSVTYSPTLENCELVVPSDESFTSVAKGLKSSTEYAVRAYVKSTLGQLEDISYSWNTFFWTKSIQWPEFNNLQVKDEERTVNSIPVTCGIASLGDGTLQERGFCWLKDTGLGESVTLETCTGSQAVTDGTEKEFSYTIPNLEIQTSYRIRAYAKMMVDNEVTVCYSGEAYTSTTDYYSPSLNVGVDNISYLSASLEGRIDGGNMPVIEKGFVLSKEIYEVRIDNADQIVKASDTFEATLSDLTYNTYYNVRSYVKCQKGESTVMIYSGTNQFKTAEIDFVTFEDVIFNTSVHSLQMNVTLNIESKDGITLKKCGFCAYHHTDEYREPTISDLKVEMDATEGGDYQLTLDKLLMSSTYRSRPYVVLTIGDKEIVYYHNSTFWCNTNQYGLNLYTSDITETSCIARAEFYETYDLTGVEYGFIWSTDRESDKSTWSKLKCDNLSFNVFSGTITGLVSATQYFISVYYVVNGKTQYQDGIWEFTTARLPSQDDNDSPNMN